VLVLMDLLLTQFESKSPAGAPAGMAAGAAALQPS
jgi:hypothetical protein